MSMSGAAVRDSDHGRPAGWKQSAAVRWLLLLLFVLLFCAVLSPRLIPKTYNLELGSVSTRDIAAPRQWEDERATELAKEQAAESVEPKYSIVALRNETLVDQIVARMEQLNADTDVSFDNKVEIYRREIPARYDAFVDKFAADNRDSETYNPGLLEEMARNVKEQRYTIPEETFYKLPLLSGQRLQGIRQVAAEAVRRLMSEQLTDAETAHTAALLTRIAGRRSVVVVEHDLEFVRALGQRVTVLHEGSVLAEGPISQVQDDPRVVEVYLGR